MLFSALICCNKLTINFRVLGSYRENIIRRLQLPKFAACRCVFVAPLQGSKQFLNHYLGRCPRLICGAPLGLLLLEMQGLWRLICRAQRTL